MAANKIASRKRNCLFLITILIVLALLASDSQGMKETNMTLFLHDYYGGGPNATDFFVAGIRGKEWGYFKFGCVFVCDVLMTQGIQLDSKPIARIQGIVKSVSLDGINTQSQLSILFTNGKYNGSTLELQGVYNQLATVYGIPIVSGTGIFRFATGYVTAQTILYDLTISYDVTMFNITVQHY